MSSGAYGRGYKIGIQTELAEYTLTFIEEYAMDRIFNMDNKFFSAMSRLGDLMILNIITLIFCLPIITIGPALTACFYVTLKMARNEESYIVKGFWKSFKQNLRQGIIIGLIMLGSLAFLLVDFAIVRDQLSGGGAKVMYFLLVFVALLWTMLYLYVFPVLAKFYNSVKNTIVNAFLMSIRHLPFTILMAAVTAVPFVVFYFGSGQVQAAELLILFMGGISGLCYANSFMLVRIFDNYIPKEEVSSDMEFTVPEEETPGGEE